MKCNLAQWDRLIRFILAVLMLTYFFAGGPNWMLLGLYFLMTTAWGFDPLYAFWGLRTIRARHLKEDGDLR
jgi:Na+-driven multidrug efflux pump